MFEPGLIFMSIGARLTARGGAPQGGFCVGQQVEDLTPEQVSQGIADGRYLLVDVREPNEVAVEAYPDGVVVPLSSFDPKNIPDPGARQVVFACRSGKRSVTASLAAQAAGFAYDKHLAGGMLGWKAAGLPTKTGG
jgi:rhodanese-related sulfurtransferase